MGKKLIKLKTSTTIIFQMSTLFSLVGVLLSVAFFTLMERKIMGLAHYRKGPNKVTIWGISQPIADALKLLTKEFSKFSFIKKIMFMSGPSMAMTLMLLSWGWYESFSNMLSCGMKIMVVVSLMSLTAYAFMAMSWGSNSKYSMIGGYRAIAQIISYEVCLVLFILCTIYLFKSFNFYSMQIMQKSLWAMMSTFPIFLCWCMICMAESNRTPFDMAEGESEIVSGFNIEYGGGLFTLIFISEYGMIMVLSFISTLIFMGSNLTLLKTFLFCFLFVWTRCSFPRVRYDNLMLTCWKLALPYSLGLLMFMMMV